MSCIECPRCKPPVIIITGCFPVPGIKRCINFVAWTYHSELPAGFLRACRGRRIGLIFYYFPCCICIYNFFLMRVSLHYECSFNSELSPWFKFSEIPHLRSKNVHTGFQKISNINTLVVPVFEIGTCRSKTDRLPIYKQAVPVICRNVNNKLLWLLFQFKFLPEMKNTIIK